MKLIFKQINIAITLYGPYDADKPQRRERRIHILFWYPRYKRYQHVQRRDYVEMTKKL